MASTTGSTLSRQRSAPPSVLDVVKMMQQAAEEGEGAAIDRASPPQPPPSPPPLGRQPSQQHSALQPPRFNMQQQQQQQQQGEAGEVMPWRSSLRLAGGSSASCLRRASSAAGGSTCGLVVRQGCADQASPLAARLCKRCAKALALLERLQLPGGLTGCEARDVLPAAALRTCKVRRRGCGGGTPRAAEQPACSLPALARRPCCPLPSPRWYRAPPLLHRRSCLFGSARRACSAAGTGAKAS